MKAWAKVLIILLLSFSTVFTCVGYAALTDELSITGTIEVSEPDKVYITDILSVTGSTTEPTYEIASYTVVRSSVTLGSGGADTVNMTIKVKNNTDILYGFNAIRYSSSAYDNANIVVTTDMSHKTVDKKGNVLDEGTVIEPGGTIEFTATFSHKDGVASSDLALNSLVNYEFLPWDQITADVDAGVANDVLEQFENILNDPDMKTELDDQMQNNSSETGYYIANFDEADAADKALVESLFGNDKLNMIINGEETSIRLIIKEQDVYGDSQKEYTLYMTTHSLKRADADQEESGGWFGTTSYWASPVYAVVFTVDGDGTWSQLGDMYTGRGEINDYDGWSWGGGEGSVNTDTWESTQAYGSAAAGSSISQVIKASAN